MFEWAQELELVDADADLDVAITMGTGWWDGRSLTGDPPPPRRPEVHGSRSSGAPWEVSHRLDARPSPSGRSGYRSS